MADLMSQGVLGFLKINDTSRRVVMLFLTRGSLDEYLNRSGVLRIIDGDETRVHADLH